MFWMEWIEYFFKTCSINSLLFAVKRTSSFFILFGKRKKNSLISCSLYKLKRVTTVGFRSFFKISTVTLLFYLLSPIEREEKNLRLFLQGLFGSSESITQSLSLSLSYFLSVSSELEMKERERKLSKTKDKP